MEKIADPAGQRLDELWELEWGRNLLAAAVSRVKGRLDPQICQIVDCGVDKTWTPGEVAETFGIPV